MLRRGLAIHRDYRGKGGGGGYRRQEQGLVAWGRLEQELVRGWQEKEVQVQVPEAGSENRG